MKTIQKFSFIAFLMILPLTVIGQEKSKNVEKVKFSTSIDCQSCVNKIMTNLPHEKGIKDVKCDLQTKEVEVTYLKDKNTPEEIQKSLEKLGYKAKEVAETDEIKKTDK